MSKKAPKKQETREPFPIEQFWGTLEEQRRREVMGVLFTAGALTVFLSLISYPIGNTESWRTLIWDTTSNWIGSPGNLVAWSLFFLTGLCAYLIPPLLVVCAWHTLFKIDDRGNRFSPLLPILRLSGGLIMLACCCALVSLTLRQSPSAGWIAGGLVGSWLARVMLVFGKVGAYLLLTTVSVLALLLTTNFLFVDFMDSLRRRWEAFTEWRLSIPWEADYEELPYEETGEFEEEAWGEEGEDYGPLVPSLGLGNPESALPVLVVDELDEGVAVLEEEYEDEYEEYEDVVEEDELKIYTPKDYAVEDLDDLKKKKSASERTSAVVNFGDEKKPYVLPTLDLLDLPVNTGSGPDHEEIKTNKAILERTLDEFNISARVVAVHCGPVITRYDLRPAPGVKVRGITNLQDDLALALRALSVRIIAPVPGTDVVGIEIPNRTRQDVLLREVLASDRYRETNSRLTFSLGKTISGEPFVADLRKMPHLLIAGATGSGKSVGVNSLIVSILTNSTPQEVRFMMVDPKRVELSLYQDIPHLLTPVIADPKCAAAALGWAVEEMETRYKYLSKAGVRDIQEYNERMKKWSQRPTEEGDMEEFTLPAFLPYIVIIIDELADLMMIAKAEVETNIARLAQMARAVGMHLVLATQRPSVNILTGVIKANFPARMAFKVAQINDSRVILDQKGAESLLGMGDLLFDLGGAGKPIRLQGCYVSTSEVERVVNAIKEQQKPEYLNIDFTASEDEGGGEGYTEDDMDETYLKAVDIVMEAGQASTSLLQRRLRIGYGRAARILDIMHDRGMIGPPRGSKPRELLVG